MRDLLVVIFIFAAIYYSFKKPYLGVCAWIWVALFAPANWAFGFSQHLRINLTIVLITLLSVLFVQKNKKMAWGKQSFWLYLFWFLTLISSFFHQTINDADIWFEFVKFSKVVAIYTFVCLTLSKRLHIETFIWAIVLAISSYAGMEAVKFIISFGGYRIQGVAGVIEDRNDLAVAINMCIPLVIYLWSVTKHKQLKLGLSVLLVLNIVSVIGTYSRGGFIGLSIIAIAFWLKSNRKLILTLMALIVLPTIYSFAPQEWKERQSTVTTASSKDGSFIGRLWAWKISTMIAIDNPITGGGFKSVTDPLLWSIYAPVTPDFGPVYTKPIPETIPPKAAHNIYFQVLGDHGFTGLVVYLSMMFSTYFMNINNQNTAKKNGVEWVVKLSSALSLSFIGYAITGMNVSLAYFDLALALMGVVLVINSKQLALKKDKNDLE